MSTFQSFVLINFEKKAEKGRISPLDTGRKLNVHKTFRRRVSKVREIKTNYLHISYYD